MLSFSVEIMPPSEVMLDCLQHYIGHLQTTYLRNMLKCTIQLFAQALCAYQTFTGHMPHMNLELEDLLTLCLRVALPAGGRCNIH